MFYKNIKNHIITYPTPYNITYIWSFGFLAGFMLINQIITGLFLAIYYNNTIEYAFDSVEFLMRNINYGWLIRYAHANGASVFFIILYIHISKGLYYKSFLYPRQNIWYSGMLIFILVMGTSFLGYVLPWGQMSFWGATVITSLVTVIPFIGEILVNWIWGGYSVGNPTLMRFFVVHYLLPFIILALVMVHLLLLHIPGSSNPLNFDKKNEKIKFFPFFYFKDIFILLLLLIFFIYIICYMPNVFNHADNYIKANAMITPKHIVPEWYFLPFYAILRAIASKSIGIILFGISLGIYFFLPILSLNLKINCDILINLKKNINIFFKHLDFILTNDLIRIFDIFIRISEIFLYIYIIFFNKIKKNIDCMSILFYFFSNIEYNILCVKKKIYNIYFYSNTLIYKQNFWILVVIFISLGYIGQLEVNTVTIELGQDLTLLYFLIIFLLSLSDRIFFYLFMVLVFFIYLFGLFGKGFFSNIEIIVK